MIHRKITAEKNASHHNSIKRLLFACISIAVEIFIWWCLFDGMSSYSEALTVITRFLALLSVLLINAQDRTSSLKLPWIIIILSFPAFGMFMLLLVGTSRQTRKMRQKFSNIEDELFSLLPSGDEAVRMLKETDPAAGGIASYIRSVSKYPVFGDSDIEYFSSTSDAIESQISEISKAEKFVFMEYFAIQQAAVWERIEPVLADRVKNGVEVRVFYDDIGSISFTDSAFARHLRSLGIKCRVFNPFKPGVNIFLNNRDHRKITVIDGKVGFTGGYNIADEYFNITHPYGQWKDSGVKITGPAVKNLTAAFLEMWNTMNGASENDTDYSKYMPDISYEQSEKGVFIAPYADTPVNDMKTGEDVYISMINKAEKYCYFTTPYLIISDEMKDALRLASMRGVDVRIVTPGIPDKKIVYSVTRSFYSPLAKYGVRIFEWTPGFCHAKMSIADGKMAVCGTINLDYRSLYHHFENSCFFYGASAIEDMKKDFDRLFSESREVTQKYSAVKYDLHIGQLILRLFASLL